MRNGWVHLSSSELSLTSPWLASAKPASTEDHRQAEEDRQAGPGEAVQRGFRTAGAGEHRAATGCQPSHAIAFRAVQEYLQDEQHAAADPDPGENRRKHQAESDGLGQKGAQSRRVNRFNQAAA